MICPSRAISIICLLCLICIAACDNSSRMGTTPTFTPTHVIGHRLVVASAVELGTIGQPRTVTARDGGATAIIGGQLLWTFGDTLLSTFAADGSQLRSNTAALADPRAPLAVHEPLDAKGCPAQFLPLTSEELAYNKSTGSSSDRYALWVGSVVNDVSGAGLVFYIKAHVKPGFLNYDLIGIGTASVAARQTSAVRDPGLLFTATEPLFANAMVDGGMVYLYGNQRGSQNLVVARAELRRARSRSAYTFWNGAAWDTEVAHSAPLFGGVPGAVSVSFNRYLQQYVAVSSKAFSNQVLIRSAPAPQGPWSTPIVAFVGRTPGTGNDYAGIEHAELASQDGRAIIISYYHPRGGFSGEMVLVQLIFA